MVVGACFNRISERQCWWSYRILKVDRWMGILGSADVLSGGVVLGLVISASLVAKLFFGVPMGIYIGPNDVGC